MSSVELFEPEAITIFREEGETRERELIALKMLERQLATDFISEMTGLSVDKIKALVEARQKYRQEGRQKGRERVTCNMLQRKYDIDKIAEITGLSVDDIRVLQEELNDPFQEASQV